MVLYSREGQSEWYCIQEKVKVSGTVSKRDRLCVCVGGGGGGFVLYALNFENNYV